MNTVFYSLKEKDRLFKNNHPVGIKITRKVALAGALVFALLWAVMVITMMVL